MKKFEYTVRDEIGIHARPAGMLVSEAKKYESMITIRKGGREANATRLMSVMSLAVKCGETVEVEVNGPDEEIAFENLKEFFEDNL